MRNDSRERNRSGSNERRRENSRDRGYRGDRGGGRRRYGERLEDDENPKIYIARIPVDIPK